MKIFMVELTNRCNMDCWFCPHPKMKRPQGDMSMDTVRRVISKTTPRSMVILNNIGESLLHPQFFEIVDMFDDAHIGTMVTTNGYVLTNELVTKLLASKLSMVRVSVDFINEDMEKIIEPLLNDPRFRVNIKGTDRDAITRFREKYGHKGNITFLVDWAGQMDFDADFSPNKDCTFLNNEYCVVLWDGQVCPCCYDYEGDNILGDLDEIDDLQHREYDLCKHCNGLDLRMM